MPKRNSKQAKLNTTIKLQKIIFTCKFAQLPVQQLFDFLRSHLELSSIVDITV